METALLRERWVQSYTEGPDSPPSYPTIAHKKMKQHCRGSSAKNGLYSPMSAERTNTAHVWEQCYRQSETLRSADTGEYRLIWGILYDTIPVPTITYMYVGCREYTAICDPAGGDCRANPPGPAAVDQTSLKPFCVHSSYAIKRQILEVQDILDRL